ncbi:MAG: glycine--tRNA ligase subunit beta [Lysobacterales bacterium]
MSGAGKPLLIEIGTEELPPKALDELAAALAKGVADGLSTLGIQHAADDASTYCSPRRLAVYIPEVASMQPDTVDEVWGPPASVGHDANGQPTKALLGFARKCGVDVTDLLLLPKGDAVYFCHRHARRGRPLVELLPGVVGEALKALPIPRPMRWGDHDFAFVRPVHWLVMLHGGDVVDGELLGVRSGRETRGHRFLHPQPVRVADAGSWLDALRDAKVLADPDERRRRVETEVARVAPKGLVPRLSPALRDEIANLTEWPVAIACAFDREFLAVPAEALVMTMEANQRFVPVFDADGKLTEHFIGVANIDSKDPTEIRKGYERVIRPRFADAKFFFDKDRETPLAGFRDALAGVTYQQALGSVADKCARVATLARGIAEHAGVGPEQAAHAAALSKCDLVTRMVGEFPELQGVMGRHYAAASGEAADTAAALDEYYMPRQSGDRIAEGPLARVLAVADRIDTLAGIFAVGQKPTGNKDPFALRRTALGLARTLIEAPLPLDLDRLIAAALEQIPDTAFAAGQALGKTAEARACEPRVRRVDVAATLREFIVERLKGYYADQGITIETFEAVRVLAPADLTDFDQRLRAVVEFAQLPEAQALAVANKRIGNILRQAGGAGGDDGVDPALLEDGAERELAAAIDAARADVAPRAAGRDFVGVLKRLAALRAPVDRYFDAVMVMADDPALRRNRLALLRRLRALFLGVADIAQLPAS